jgi:CO/xanthine dehydrogenase Mo-binding subunit
MTANTSHDHGFSRRTFLAGTGALVMAVGAPRLLNPQAAYAALDDEFPIGPALVDPDQIDSWVAIGGDGNVTIFTGKEEQGTGVRTAQMQLAADELDVSMSKIMLIISDTSRTPDQGFSSASQSLATEFGPHGLRQACAEARAALLAMASARLGEPVSSLTVSNGVVSVAGDASRSVQYASLIGGRKFNLPQTGKAVPKAFGAYKVVGKSVPRVEIPDIVFGNYTYVPDIRVPGMLYARVVRPPTLDSTLVRVGGFAGGAPTDLVKVVVKRNFVAVVCRSEWGAIQAAQALVVTWKTARLPSHETFYDDLVAQSPTRDQVVVDTDDVDRKLASAGKRISATYRFPLQMHGPLGASASTAWVKETTATVWTSSQGVYPLRALLATALGLPARNIRVIFTEGSGHYGMCGADNASLDAAVISQAVGKPVRVQYSRADEHLWENYGSPFVWSMRGAVEGNGANARLTAWSREAWTATRGNRPGPPANLPSGILLGFTELPLVPSPPGAPSSAPNVPDNPNSVPAYAIPSQRVVTHTGRHTFLNAPLRSPNRFQNTFANESFVDELAHAAGADPVAFRLQHLKAAGGPSDEPHHLRARLVEAIERNAVQAKWQPKVAASKLGSGRYKTGRGIAAMVYEGDNGINSSIWQVTVDTKTGKVVVDKCWSVQDCGPVINPTGMRMQAEGSLMQGTSRTLIEELKWTPGGVTSHDWATYPVIRFNRLPEFELEIVDRPEYEVMGAGEVLITNAAAGIANAIFDATGVRLRQVPFTPARVRAALKQAGRLAA